MAITLIVNPGSTSRKYALYRDGEVLASLIIEQAPDGVAACLSMVGGIETCESWVSDTLEGAVEPALTRFIEKGVIGNVGAITQIGVRVVAPGVQFAKHQVVTETYVRDLEHVAYLVPIHIPLVLSELQQLQEVLPQVPVVAVSDSAFHQTQSAAFTTISLGDETLRRYGYHGLSFSSVVRKLQVQQGGVPARVIVLHVGGGVSVCALKDGKSIATSMGFTPASGMLMGTRGGDVGADALAGYMYTHDIGPVEALEILYRGAGFKAVAGISDLRLLLERAAQGDDAAMLARDAFIEQVAVWVAAHVVRLGGLDAMVLTATALIRNPELRARLLQKLQLFGVSVDVERNEVLIGKEGCIETSGSVPIYVLKTDEMGEMEKVVKTIT